MQAITGDSDISTTGRYVDAVNTIYNGTYTTTTIGDTTFHALSNGLPATDGIITDNISPADGNFNNHGYSGGSAAYEYIMNNGSDVSSATVTIIGLDPGVQYQIQAWAYWPGPYNADIDGTYAPGAGTDPVTFTEYSGSFAIGTFVPTGTTFSFGYNQNHPSNGGFLDDIAIREVPEPGTYVLMLAGLSLLVLVRRVRRSV
jgi:hypothetical protein